MFAAHDPNQALDEDMRAFQDVADPDKRERLGLIAAMDRAVGRLVEALEEVGQLDNTLLFFVSDNGGAEWAKADNGPLRGSKGTFYEGGVRVPAFALWPGKIEPGETDALAYVADIFTTFACLGGGDISGLELDGVDLSPVLFDHATTSGRQEIVFMLEDSERLRRGAIIQWPWKLRRTALKGGPWVYELFNIEEDPCEQQNAYRLSKEEVEVTQRLSRALDDYLVGAPPAFWQAGDGRPPAGWSAPAVIGPDL